MAENIPSKEELLDAAFKRWWDEDYSWAGLRKKSWPGAKKGATLQDYWRERIDVEKDILSFGGRDWTKFHLPMMPIDGRRSPKEKWNNAENQTFNEAVTNLATIDDESDDQSGNIAFLDGVVFPGKIALEGRTISASFRKALFYGESYFSRSEFIGRSNFANAFFSGRATFVQTHFRDTATFCQTSFADGADFQKAVFDYAADFDRARFAAEVNFGSAIFSHGGDFLGAFFGDECGFANARFFGLADFRGAHFEAEVYMSKAEFFSKAYFRDSVFGSRVYFPNAIFRSVADFSSHLDGEIGRMNFSGVKFCGDALFMGRQFQDSATFSRTQFEKLPVFHGASLHPDTDLSFVQFRKGVEPASEMELDSRWRGLSRVTLSVVKGVLDSLEKRIDPKWASDPKSRLSSKVQKVFHKMAGETDLWFQRRLALFPLGIGLVPGLEVRYNSRTQSYESAYRTLRVLSAANNNIEHEAMFYTLELDARCARTDVPLTDRIVAKIFRSISVYGTSLWRPIRTWLDLLFFSFVGVTLWGFATVYDAGRTLNLAAFREISGQIVSLYTPFSWIRWLVTQGNGRNFDHAVMTWSDVVPGMMILGIFAQLSSTILLALFLIALRRKFQIR